MGNTPPSFDTTPGFMGQGFGVHSRVRVLDFGGVGLLGMRDWKSKNTHKTSRDSKDELCEPI